MALTPRDLASWGELRFPMVRPQRRHRRDPTRHPPPCPLTPPLFSVPRAPRRSPDPEPRVRTSDRARSAAIRRASRGGVVRPTDKAARSTAHEGTPPDRGTVGRTTIAPPAAPKRVVGPYRSSVRAPSFSDGASARASCRRGFRPSCRTARSRSHRRKTVTAHPTQDLPLAPLRRFPHLSATQLPRTTGHPQNRPQTLIFQPARQSEGTVTMTTATWITMIVIMAFVWGGFSFVLSTAIRKESEKSGD